jgi:site-specific DNA-adenine methylase
MSNQQIREAWGRGALDAPFPWGFGGKRRVADVVWRAFGNVVNVVEPFFGSGAVLLGRPEPWHGNETVNDIDGLVCNFWRSIQHSPEETAEWAEWPVNECDLHARHSWLLAQITDDFQSKLEGDPDWHDPKIAGWWVWGICCWIGGEFCSGKGPWQVVDGQLVHLGNAGVGVKRKLVHLGDGKGVNRKLVHLGDGKGVNRRLVHLGGRGGSGVTRHERLLIPWFQALSDRLKRVRVCSGDWSRVCGPSVTFKHGMTAVFLDPPYADTAGRDPTIYRHDNLDVAHDVREWAIEMGKRPDMRIALCGYEGEHEMPPQWTVHEWKAKGGYASQGSDDSPGADNAKRERIWFSPACLPVDRQMSLFDYIAAAAE